MRNRFARLLMASIGLLLLAVTAQAQISWHGTWEEAQAAAAVSHKPILAYIYQPSHAACVQMDRTTFQETKVIAAMGAYESLAMNGSLSPARAFCEKYGVGVRSNTDRGVQMDFSAIPAYLLLEADGREYFRAFGYYPMIAYLTLLDRLNVVVDLQRKLAAQPGDALLCGQLGHVYLTMERDDLGKPYLQQAVKLDPQNQLGAKADAELDLIILAIPDDPAAAVNRLMTYRFTYRDTPRRLEIQYYIAVAQIAATSYDAAERTLHDFAAIDPKDPDYKSPWAVRADLLAKQLKALRAKP
jgi:hypothetical protein